MFTPPNRPRVAVFAATLLLIGTVRAPCQAVSGTPDQADTTVRSDANPTRPVLFSVRPELYKLNGDITQAALIFRYDRAALRKRRLLPGQRGVVLRFEMPAVAAHANETAAQAGLGDAYAQVLLVPYFRTGFAFVVGSGVIVPTATDTMLGTGKLVLAPAIGPVWFFPGHGMAVVKVQSLKSVGGRSTRPDIDALLITPQLMRIVSDRSWILVDTETKTDWRRNRRTGVKSGVQYGRLVTSNLGVWLKPEIWWGRNRDGLWNLKFGLVWYR